MNFAISRGGWKKAYRFVALRYEKACEEGEPEEAEPYQLFATSQYQYRVFVTDRSESISFVVWFYNQRGGAENLIKGAPAKPARSRWCKSTALKE